MQQDQGATRDRRAPPAGVGIHHGVSGADVDADFHAFFYGVRADVAFSRVAGESCGAWYPAALAFEAALALLFARLARAGRRKLLYLYYAGRTVKNYCSRRTVSRVLCVCQPSFRVSEVQGRDKKNKATHFIIFTWIRMLQPRNLAACMTRRKIPRSPVSRIQIAAELRLLFERMSS
ncbi:hypothetical protein PAHAL_5G158900 [Panicum hallii]|jgi:hypothetical protein|uniref:Uncharacterized protein n=1 Tax=Panicum hallii TaxID=206008 RepID=A0A2T8IK43_9POAL|nr:hypothetical protein PAHAL_5G158900 [Panicum hallii]